MKEKQKLSYVQKVAHNKTPIIDKDFLELSAQELKQFIQDAKTNYFYYKKDGVYIACGKENENKDGKFENELFACKKLAEYGHEVYLLPENYAKDENRNVKVHGDTITDNRILELKQTPANIQGNYRKAKHQATDVFIHIKGEITKENAIDQIRRAIRSMQQDKKLQVNFTGKVYLYFGKIDKFFCFDFDNVGNYQQISPRKK